MSESANTARTAVVTGHHPFDVPNFHALFRALPEIDAYPQHMEDFSADAGQARETYDAVVFYNMHTETPAAEGPWFEKGVRAALERLGETDQGIVVLHHAILAYPEWDFWGDLVGIQDRSFGYHIGQELQIQIEDSKHPITSGLEGFGIVDETYTMASTGEGSEILLTADHELSMRSIGWTRQFRKARVFCFQSGHDAVAFANPSFRTVLSRGIQWVAGRI